VERVRSNVPPRLDRLDWSRWHARVIVALGITWILDGLEASLVANLGPALEDPRTLGLRAAQVGLASSAYLVGQVAGALVFGRLTDSYGRKRLFLVTLGLYLGATAASGAAPSFAAFLVLRFFAGAGIGGEYSAINSAIDELVPARLRGRVDLAINGSYWIGVGAGALLTLFLLDPARVPVALGWRFAFGLGAVLGLVILFVRREVPESPRWLLLHGRVDEADDTMTAIERAAGQGERERPAPVELHVTGAASLRRLVETLVRHKRRALLGVVLMLSQAFLYNAIFFSYGLVLHAFDGVAPDRVGLYMLPFATGNFAGPLVLGRLFDHWGRRAMIPATYAISGALLALTGVAFALGWLDATTQTLSWCAVFFFASAAASSAYLTVSELFGVDVRGMVIAIFYSCGTLAGAAAPLLFGRFVDSNDRWKLLEGYVIAAALMLAAAAVARVYGVASEGRSLEELSA